MCNPKLRLEHLLSFCRHKVRNISIVGHKAGTRLQGLTGSSMVSVSELIQQTKRWLLTRRLKCHCWEILTKAFFLLLCFESEIGIITVD